MDSSFCYSSSSNNSCFLDPWFLGAANNAPAAGSRSQKKGNGPRHGDWYHQIISSPYHITSTRTATESSSNNEDFGTQNVLDILDAAEDILEQSAGGASQTSNSFMAVEPVPLGPAGSRQLVREVSLEESGVLSPNEADCEDLFDTLNPLLMQDSFLFSGSSPDMTASNNDAKTSPSSTTTTPVEREALKRSKSNSTNAVGPSESPRKKQCLKKNSRCLSASIVSSSSLPDSADELLGEDLGRENDIFLLDAEEEDLSFDQQRRESSSSKKQSIKKTFSPSPREVKSENRFRGYQSDQWKDRYEELTAFRNKHGHCLVPHNFPENPQLSQWIKRQRYQYKLKQMNRHSTLSHERQMALEELGFVWDSHKAVWFERFETLKKFNAKHGHCNVHSNYVDRTLAIWVKCQRRQYKLYNKGERSTMTPGRYAKLDQLGFDWNPRNL